MQITYHGGQSIEIKNKLSTVILDPEKSITKVNDVQLVGAGEYEIADTQIVGLGNNAYLIKAEDLSVVYLDGLTKLSQEEIEELGDVDVLLVPAEHPSLVADIDPKLVVPIGEKIAEFCKTNTCPEPLAILKLTKKDLVDAERKVIILKAA